MKYFVTFLFVFFVSCSTEHEFALNNTIPVDDEEKSDHWTKVGEAVEGLAKEPFDIRGLKVRVVYKNEKDKEVYGDRDLSKEIKKSKKTRVVLQVIDSNRNGGMCSGCVGKGAKIYKAAKAKDAHFIMLLTASVADNTDQWWKAYYYARAILKKPENLGDQAKNVTIVIDNYGAFQKKFEGRLERRGPVTMILNSGFRGKAFNLHDVEVDSVTKALDLMPATK